MERQRSTGTRALTPAQTTTRRGLALGLAAAPLAAMAGASAAAAATPAPAAEVAAWGDLMARYLEAQRVREAAEAEHTRCEEIACEGDESPAALATAKADLAMSKAGDHRDALILQLMATPAPHVEALRFKAAQINSEDAEYYTYALDGLLGVFTADALYFAGAGPRASRDVLDAFLGERTEWLADRADKAAERHAAATGKAVANA